MWFEWYTGQWRLLWPIYWWGWLCEWVLCCQFPLCFWWWLCHCCLNLCQGLLHQSWFHCHCVGSAPRWIHGGLRWWWFHWVVSGICHGCSFVVLQCFHDALSVLDTISTGGLSSLNLNVSISLTDPNSVGQLISVWSAHPDCHNMVFPFADDSFCWLVQ